MAGSSQGAAWACSLPRMDCVSASCAATALALSGRRPALGGFSAGSTCSRMDPSTSCHLLPLAPTTKHVAVLPSVPDFVRVVPSPTVRVVVPAAGAKTENLKRCTAALLTWRWGIAPETTGQEVASRSARKLSQELHALSGYTRRHQASSQFHNRRLPSLNVSDVAGGPAWCD